MSDTALDVVEDLNRQIDRHRETGWRELDPDRRAFALAFITSPTPRKAALEAGLPADSGARMYRDPITRAYISHLQDIMQETSIINTQFVQASILDLLPVLRGEEEAPVFVSGVGLMDVKKLHAPELLRAYDMLAKSVGFYNADLSQSGMMGIIEFMNQAGRDAQRQQLQEAPVDPKTLRVIESE